MDSGGHSGHGRRAGGSFDAFSSFETVDSLADTVYAPGPGLTDTGRQRRTELSDLPEVAYLAEAYPDDDEFTPSVRGGRLRGFGAAARAVPKATGATPAENALPSGAVLAVGLIALVAVIMVIVIIMLNG
jgi:hypothetical protein